MAKKSGILESIWFYAKIEVKSIVANFLSVLPILLISMVIYGATLEILGFGFGILLSLVVGLILSGWIKNKVWGWT